MTERRLNDPPAMQPDATNTPKGSKASTEKKPKGRQKTAGRFGTLNEFVDCGMVGLSRVEALTWLVLYRDTRDGTACTSAESIAKRIGGDRRAVTTALGELQRAGLLRQVFKGGINRGPSRYAVQPAPTPPRALGSEVP